MARNNQARRPSTKGTKAAKTNETTASPSSLPFVTPTQFIDLPSQGRFYGENHPLHNQDTVEIHYMTARDEDILTSQTLLKKGVAMERFLENILVNKKIKPDKLVIGDRNAILVGARITGYGSDYTTQVVCGNCASKVTHSFDLNEMKVYNGDNLKDVKVTPTDDGTFLTTLPLTKLEAELRLMTGADEASIAQQVSNNKKKKALESNLTTQLARSIVSLAGETDKNIIKKFIEVMPAYDSRHLRSVYRSIMPTIDLTQDFECPECATEQKMEVPFTVDFFWPN